MIASFLGIIFLGVLVYGFLITSIISLASLYTTPEDAHSQDDTDLYEQAQTMCDLADIVSMSSHARAVCETTDIGASIEGGSSVGWRSPSVASEDEDEPGSQRCMGSCERSDCSDYSEDSQDVDDSEGVACSMQATQKRHGILAYDD
jgi:hypothetical protein